MEKQNKYLKNYYKQINKTTEELLFNCIKQLNNK